MKKGKRHATAHPRTGASLLQPKPNLERKKDTRPPSPGKEGAHPRTGARLLQPKPNLERKKIRARLPRQGRCAPAHRRPPAPAKPNLERKKDTRPPSPSKEGSPPRNGARLLQPKPNLERKKDTRPPSPRQGRCAPRTGARLLQQSPNLERKKIRARLPPARKVRPRAPAHACSNQSRT